MIYYKTENEIKYIEKSSLLVGKTLAEVAKYLEAGISTLELDRIAEDFILNNGAKPAFKGYHGFPNTLCISINDEVVHGIPSKRLIKEGDIVSVDCGVVLNGFYGDYAYTFAIGEVDNSIKKLIQVTKESLIKGIENAIAGNRVGDISNAIQSYVESFNYSVVRELVGHGIGKNLHEKPDVPNFGKKGNGPLMKEGLVLAIEPMINMGKKEVKSCNDGWTVKTLDGLPSVHFEHNVVIRKNKAQLLSTYEYIEEIIK